MIGQKIIDFDISELDGSLWFIDQNGKYYTDTKQDRNDKI